MNLSIHKINIVSKNRVEFFIHIIKNRVNAYSWVISIVWLERVQLRCATLNGYVCNKICWVHSQDKHQSATPNIDKKNN